MSFQLVWGEWPENAGSLSPRDWEGLVATAADHGDSLSFGAGLARWGGQDGEKQTTFSGQVDFEVFGNGWGTVHPDGGGFATDKKANMFVVAIAEVDQSWANQSLKPSPDVGPQVKFKRQKSRMVISCSFARCKAVSFIVSTYLDHVAFLRVGPFLS